MVSLNEREQHDLNHDKYLIESGNPELLWNWDSPVGRWRANQRGRLLEALPLVREFSGSVLIYAERLN
jgi:hypothetical protein